MHPIITIGPVTMASYGLMVLLGIISGITLLLVSLKLNHIKGSKFICIVLGITALAAAFLGGYVWDHISHYLNGEGWTGGVSVMGGILLGFPTFIALALVVYRSKAVVRFLIDTFIPVWTIGHAFGRIGCFLGGCCYGKPTSIGIGTIYPEGSAAAEMYGYGVKLIPAPLYEAIFLLILTVVFLALLKRKRIVWYMIAYGVWRFLSETFLRGDNRGTFIKGVLTSAQFVTILLVLVAIAILIIEKKLKIGDYQINEVSSRMSLAFKRSEEEKKRRQELRRLRKAEKEKNNEPN